ncbi:MAG: hypothetical protein WAU85_04955 [Candidatus Absconditicoccaceae bacterium]
MILVIALEKDLLIRSGVGSIGQSVADIRSYNVSSSGVIVI